MRNAKQKVLKRQLNTTDKRFPRHCVQCCALLGEEHEPNCIFRKRTVVIKLEVEYVVDVPDSWEEDDIDFHRNESSWCSDNGIEEIQDMLKRTKGCLCGKCSWSYVREANERDEESCQLFISKLSA